MNRINLLIILFFSTLIASAQYKVTGTVTDSIGSAEAYATIRVFEQSDTTKAVALGVTDEKGAFEQDIKSKGSYRICISSVGKQTAVKQFEISEANTVAKLGSIVMLDASTTLGEIEVVAQKPIVKTEIDRLVYDVKEDSEAKTSNILEILKKVPMVTVDGEDNIYVNGNSNFKIYKNGRPNNNWSNNAKDVLKSIPASMIKKIEVIHEPGAKYDAEGLAGILNIVMDDNTQMKGVVGSVYANVTTTANANAGGYMTTQINKVSASVNYGYVHSGSYGMENISETETTYKESGNHSNSYDKTNKDGKMNLHYADVEASWDADSLNLVTFSFGGYWYQYGVTTLNKMSMFDSSNNLLYSYTNNTKIPKSRYFDFNGKLDYQHSTRHKGETLTASYLVSTTDQKNQRENDYVDLFNYPVSYTCNDMNSKLNFIEHTFQFDWTRPFAEKHKFETGAKYILRSNHSITDQNYSNPETQWNDSRHTDFNHTTHIGAAYGEYSFNSRYWGARAGLRYEYSFLKAKYNDGSNPDFDSNFSDLVPTITFNYKPNDANTLKVNFNTRISRPGISYLNPAVSESPETKDYGNADLGSTRRHNLGLTYSLMKPKIMLNASLTYAFSNNLLSSYQFVDDNGIINNTYNNIGKSRTWRLSVYARWQPFKTTTLSLNGAVAHDHMRNENINVSNQRWSMYFNLFAEQKLPWKLNLSANVSRMDWGLNGLYGHSEPLYFYGFGINRSFLKEDRLNVRLSANMPFSGKWFSTSSYVTRGDILSTTNALHHNRAFSVSVSYRFGSMNVQVKKVNKSIDNDDLEGRK